MAEIGHPTGVMPPSFPRHHPVVCRMRKNWVQGQRSKPVWPSKSLRLNLIEGHVCPD